MTEKEIEQEQYINNMRIRSIEAQAGRVPPFSEEFDNLMERSLRLQERNRELFRQLLELKQEKDN